MVNGHVWSWVKYGLVWLSCKGRGQKKSNRKSIKEGGWGWDWTDFPDIVCF